MAAYVFLGKYSVDALKRISAERTTKAIKLITKLGGKVSALYALLGQYDLLLIAEFPGTAEAMQASIALSKMTGISFTTSPALSIEDFDKMNVNT